MRHKGASLGELNNCLCNLEETGRIFNHFVSYSGKVCDKVWYISFGVDKGCKFPCNLFPIVLKNSNFGDFFNSGTPSRGFNINNRVHELNIQILQRLLIYGEMPADNLIVRIFVKKKSLS